MSNFNITLYEMKYVRADKPNIGMTFSDNNEMNNYFNNLLNIGQGMQITYDGNSYDLDQLVTTITVISEKPITSNTKTWNYARLLFENELYNSSSLFYYIIDYKQIGNRQYQFTLKLDTVMTYMSIKNTPLDLISRPSLVLREHKPRFDSLKKPIYDRFIEEGNQVVALTDAMPFTNTGGYRIRLVYRNQGETWKPAIYLFCEPSDTDRYVETLSPVYDKEFIIPAPISTDTFQTRAITGDYLIDTGDGNGYRKITDNWDVVYHVISSYGSMPYSIISVNKDDGYPQDINIAFITGDKVKIRAPFMEGATEVRNATIKINFNNDRTSQWSNVSVYPVQNEQTLENHLMANWDNIDVFDAKNEKVVEIPYFEQNNLKLYKDSFGIYANFYDDVEFDFNLTLGGNVYALGFDTSKVDKPRVKYNDPKLSTSQFSPLFLSFNGISLGIRREFMDTTYYYPALNRFEISNFMKLAINLSQPNNFLLDASDELALGKTREIDGLIKNWIVNNDVATVKDEAYTFNQYYRDLDDKARAISEEASRRNLALNSSKQVVGIAGQIGKGVAVGALGGSTLGRWGAVIGGAVGAIGAAISIYGASREHADMLEMNIIKYEQKYRALELSSAAITGSPLANVKRVGADRLRRHQFMMQDFDLNYWDMQFHKYGYQCLEYKTINLRTRKNFNFVQAILDDSLASFYKTMPTQNFIDLQKRLAEGVTFFHKSVGSNDIDWTQEKENWEV